MLENREYCKRIVEEIEAIYNGTETNEDGEIITLYDYLCDALDFEYTITSQKTYKSVKVFVTLGGPNVWIDTATACVHLAWCNERCEYPLSYDVCDEIDNIFEDYYNM